MIFKALVVWLLAVAALALCASGAPTEDQLATSGGCVRADFSPAKLFDFKNYKAAFHKTYSGLLEEMVRAKYFLSRAFRAFVSAIKYKHRKEPFYLAVNEMSDWTPEEIAASENKLMAEASQAKFNRAKEAVKAQDDLPDFLPQDVEGTREQLTKMAESGASSAGQAGQLRSLPLEKLIHTGADAPTNGEAAKRLKRRVPSNNPQYAPLELQSYGLRDEPVYVNFGAVEAPEEPASEFADAVARATNGRERNVSASGLPDEVFLDLRESGCFSVPRQQGRCGACWAFASVAIFEWMYCMKSGELVAFSEQYMIDCATEYIRDAVGCRGGGDRAGAHFAKNFGMELRDLYPYTMRQDQCPFEESAPLESTGYIRFEMEDAVHIDMELWPEYLKEGPLYVGISIAPHFREYGGGVFGWGCPQLFASHAVVLVGHGRQDGQEYWLIRNSHSTSWGEGGYGKLAKSADCIPERRGVSYDTKDGRRSQLRAQTNENYDSSAIESKFMDGFFG